MRLESRRTRSLSCSAPCPRRGCVASLGAWPGVSQPVS